MELRIIKLINNTTLVGIYEQNEDMIKVTYPFEIIVQTYPNEHGLPIGETNLIRPYMTMTDDREVNFESINVMTTYSLSEKFYRSFQNMVDNCYNKETSFSGDFIDDHEPVSAGDEYDQPLTPEEEEWLREALLISKKDNNTIH